ncbi:hypothetical protein DH2020_042722 [Rehmannia glutinosa]|uniref:Reverse transcriptase domain-containing protein n=1 Tax=Rehmannia glutinosa TaxID=99300 RepID=A0ABR0UN10_REHGL
MMVIQRSLRTKLPWSSLNSINNSLAQSEILNHRIREIFGNGPLLDETQGLDLIKPITNSRFWMPFGHWGRSLSGIDGYSSAFFKKSRTIVGEQVCDLCQEFFSSGCLLKQWNHTILALIPKSDHSSKVGDFRPIACCKVIYKLISKILAARMADVLDPIIDGAQVAFVKGRNMVEHIHLMQELLRQYNRKRTGARCTIKIDLRKAFDSISWDFLRDVLMGLGFPHLFVSWIMECVSTTSYSLSINGGTYGLFKGQRGLRQGDPLSPYLFVICLEYLSRLINKKTTNTHFNYHPKCGPLNITHLAFAR